MDFLRCRLKQRVFWTMTSEVCRGGGERAPYKNFEDLDSSRLAYNNLKLNENVILSKKVYASEDLKIDN